MPQKTKQTPMMQQYLAVKEKYPDAFLFYRLGDFYELFNEDALKAAQILELTLTARNKNATEPIPMCGVPHHAAASYIDTLVQQGYKVAICEQMEDPKTAKGMVKREVVQLVTPGTAMTEKSGQAKENNFLTTIFYQSAVYGFAYTDLSTGEIKVSQMTDFESILNELLSLQTKEVVINDELPEKQVALIKQQQILVSIQDQLMATSEYQFVVQDVNEEIAKKAVQQLISYLMTTQKRQLGHLQLATYYEVDQYLKLNHAAKLNLELTQSLRTGHKSGTLLWLLDETKTAMGGRLLKQWVERPLLNLAQIKSRQVKVQNLLTHFFERNQLQTLLKQVYDLERLAGRVAFGNINGRDLIQLKTSLQQIPELRTLLTAINDDAAFSDLLPEIDPVSEVADLIEAAIIDEAPLSITDGGVIKDGYNQQLDDYRDAMTNGKNWLAQLEAKERKITGINSLKIGYNRVFGYFIEVTRANLANLPKDRYERKQTLSNAERFITPELKAKEQLILQAQEQSTALEYEIFTQIRATVKTYIKRLQKLAHAIATLDCLQSFAVISENYHYVCPNMGHDKQRDVAIIQGRHPVVEKVLGAQNYIPNDIKFDQQADMLLITGPNMSGKSTYMRQLALTVIMAQIGCFVPAQQAQLPVFDQIFTRIGAADDLISGQSTFMVEMMEANQALTQATDRSLLLFDEIGRGTATYDGMALAQAIIEYIHEHLRAKTLFSTHYHELTTLSDQLTRLKNIHVGAVEENGELVFLHKMMLGPADKSYGVHVAKLAGMPTGLLNRAADILKQLEKQSVKNNVKQNTDKQTQIDLFQLEQTTFDETKSQVLSDLEHLDLMGVTPLEALNQLYQWQKDLKK